MAKKRFAAGLATGLLVLGLAGGAKATLTTVGTATFSGSATPYKLIYDDDLKITWLDYTEGAAIWQTQMKWAEGLNSTLTYNITTPGFTWTGDWRLPSAGNDPQWGLNQTTSEMGHLYYVEMGLSGGSSAEDLNRGVFDNLAPFWYWSGTEYDILGIPLNAWQFCMHSGLQNWMLKEDILSYGLAVRAGQISAAPVPEPTTMLLMGTGLAGLLGLRRRGRGCSSSTSGDQI